MTQPLLAAQQGIYTRLAAYTALTDVLGAVKVYDHVPQGTDAPYVVIGDDSTSELDTKTENGWDISLFIHCWDFKKSGRKSVKTLMSHVYDALHKAESSIAITGFSLTMIRCETQQSFQEQALEGAGDHYYHGVQVFRILISET